MNLILIEPSELGGADLVRSARLIEFAPLDARGRHLLQVLKVTPGQTVRIGQTDGPYGIGTVVSAGHGRVTLSCAFDEHPPPIARVDLLLALPRPKVMRRLWAQLSAIGVRRIILTNAARVERNYFDTHVLEPDCYRPLLIEGLQQARDTRLPHVNIHRQFRKLLEDELDQLTDTTTRLVADPAASGSIREQLHDKSVERVVLAVGPEGGWNEFERSLLEARGFAPVSMGPRTLRSDTACIALLTLVNEAIVNGES